jgi:hypothetical protein
MRRATVSLLLLAAVPGLALAQTQAATRPVQKPDADRLGMSCAQILKMASTEWTTYYTAHNVSPDASTRVARATAVYGKCYDARTDSLAAALAHSGKGPSKAARADFAQFEAALGDFAAKALTDAAPPADDGKRAYVALYEKQFRYGFYQEYEAKTTRPVKPASAGAKAPGPAVASAAAPPSATGGKAAASAPTAQDRARSDADPVTTAKNRFGKLLEVLPDDTMHELHRAFGDVIGTHQISEATRLAVYRYAIFILEPPSAAPSYQPPF